MKAVLYSGPGRFEIRELESARLEARDVRIRVELAGLCGTDLHVHDGEFGATFPLVPGHEVVGTIIEAGPQATIQLGTRVAIEVGTYCGTCRKCTTGRAAYCENLTAIGIQTHGGFAEEIVVPEWQCHPLDTMRLEHAAFIEPTACALHGLERMQLPAGASLLVIGAGPTGQLLALLAKRNGAASVTIAAPTSSKLDLARELGADETVLIDRADPAAAIDDLLARKPDGFDGVIEASGSPVMLELAMRAVGIGGTVLVYGMAREADVARLSPYDIFARQLTIRGSYAQYLEFGKAIAYLKSGGLPVHRLITHRFALDQFSEALDALASSDCIKAIIQF
ncbi:zinc-dependent alcohol dehydrogenase family protein [Microbacterium trichothecenolyticum]|uniref:Zinc-dependent alcohol dehydrogenase family protein n=1 Tax=Microbacterium ureisolvens TaxID=2781186 RepID=A0ABS7HYK9_9MICO|nr:MULTISPECIES: zinc-dependent alcohol dehydrogenase family protein [Microbacterium]MBW9110469.1 zinc-dependent alcohol dehydrogenase family protein [Microbacterium ureisolvens]MBW9120574.1 zinc-dependent alcohol dehydrogenase family protein [Microbacterium trichothecenolyticum]